MCSRSNEIISDLLNKVNETERKRDELEVEDRKLENKFIIVQAKVSRLEDEMVWQKFTKRCLIWVLLRSWFVLAVAFVWEKDKSREGSIVDSCLEIEHIYLPLCYHRPTSNPATLYCLS
ncbi:hypothetical protein ACH5RR_003593 [Cinchona calisaya]|uniref:Uncharacterized protein n=1 Tax=Cinchona calisaya TaxID=153742 RepID=A0ABD3AV67_9GENT